MNGFKIFQVWQNYPRKGIKMRLGFWGKLYKYVYSCLMGLVGGFFGIYFAIGGFYHSWDFFWIRDYINTVIFLFPISFGLTGGLAFEKWWGALVGSISLTFLSSVISLEYQFFNSGLR
jgi:hypothetical protein